METSNEQFCCSETKKRSMKKRTRFYPHVKVYQIQHFECFSAVEIASMWYIEDDYMQINQEMKSTLRRVKAGEPLESDQCFRGLEFRTPKGYRGRHKRKKDSYDEVLNEQEAQWEQGFEDEDAIASLYSAHSKPCMKAARKRAIQDEKNVRSLMTPRSRPSLERDASPSAEQKLTEFLSPVTKSKEKVQGHHRMMFSAAA